MHANIDTNKDWNLASLVGHILNPCSQSIYDKFIGHLIVRRSINRFALVIPILDTNVHFYTKGSCLVSMVKNMMMNMNLKKTHKAAILFTSYALLAVYLS